MNLKQYLKAKKHSKNPAYLKDGITLIPVKELGDDVFLCSINAKRISIIAKLKNVSLEGKKSILSFDFNVPELQEYF